ncbi:hypothetical protein QA584_28290 [Anaerocolumna sp. AGMB13025]|uniref:hypothetical protein n=1 Tax=Anaerocolumna sp. AGMB13025 TaxID=3039116 RepID=UPI00241FCB5B|nr:hypothetical protein [Anaerocolumna sp. AGMB13025]WFR57459.1 hypothetical protein QA584_28290 [Anaerocolumna sp. AGMB13025]
MNRTEYYETLKQIYEDLENPNGNFQDSFPASGEELEDLKKYAAVSLMVTDRFYTNLSKLMHDRKEL